MRRREELRFTCNDIRALVEAMAEGFEVKPFQVAKRRVFKKYGIAGTRKDGIFTAIIYKAFRGEGLLRRIAEAAGVDLSEERSPLYRAAVLLAAYLLHLDPLRDPRLLKPFRECVAEILSEDESRMFLEAWEALRRVKLEPRSEAEALELKYQVPVIIIERVSRLLPRSELEDFLRAVNEAPPLGFRVNMLKATVEEVLEELRREGVEAWRSERVPWVVRYRGRINYDELPALREGKIVPQDESSALAAALLKPEPGDRVVDLCAAPGGKTTHLAEIAGNKATIVAFDIYPDRMERLRELAIRTGTYISIHPVLADGRDAPSIIGEEWADKILLDPPCSTTGAIAKCPDARWRLTEEKIAELVQLQRELLEAANKLLKPGGRLLYTTCSVLPEENEENIKWFLERHPCYRIVPLRGPYEESKLLPGTMRAWPHKHRTTGFYYALLEKRGRC